MENARASAIVPSPGDESGEGTSAASADAVLTLVDLLWAPSTKVGRSGVTIGTIVSAAVEIADTEGLVSLTMRALASRVGVGAMTLYGYVPTREALLELMTDQVTGETYTGHATPSEVGGWRDGVRHIARRVFEHALQHPWLPEQAPARPVLGPGVCRTYEAELAAVDGIGLSDIEMDQVVTLVRGLATHGARWQVALDAARSRSGLSDQQWWAQVAPRLAAAMAGESMPLSTRVGESVSSAGEPWAAVELGVQTCIDGLGARLAARQ